MQGGEYPLLTRGIAGSAVPNGLTRVDPEGWELMPLKDTPRRQLIHTLHGCREWLRGWGVPSGPRPSKTNVRAEHWCFGMAHNLLELCKDGQTHR
jgi:hypothetical protein